MPQSVGLKRKGVQIWKYFALAVLSLRVCLFRFAVLLSVSFQKCRSESICAPEVFNTDLANLLDGIEKLRTKIFWRLKLRRLPNQGSFPWLTELLLVISLYEMQLAAQRCNFIEQLARPWSQESFGHPGGLVECVLVTVFRVEVVFNELGFSF